MSSERIIPDAPCKLIGKPSDPKPGSIQAMGSSMQWQVIACPHCGKKHLHGAGNSPEESKHMLGHRTAHCIDGDSSNVGYNLVEYKPEV